MYIVRDGPLARGRRSKRNFWTNEKLQFLSKIHDWVCYQHVLKIKIVTHVRLDFLIKDCVFISGITRIKHTGSKFDNDAALTVKMVAP